MPFPVPSSVVTIVSICTRILKINAEVFFLPRDKRSHENDLPDHDLTSTGNTNKHVVVVMDAMTEFSTEPLQRALDNVVTIACAVTLLGSCHVSTILVSVINLVILLTIIAFINFYSMITRITL